MNRRTIATESSNTPKWILIFLQQPLSETSKSHRPYLWSRSKCWMRAHKRTFNAQRLKSQIWTMGFRCFVSFANSTEFTNFFKFLNFTCMYFVLFIIANSNRKNSSCIQRFLSNFPLKLHCVLFFNNLFDGFFWCMIYF